MLRRKLHSIDIYFGLDEAPISDKLLYYGMILFFGIIPLVSLITQILS